MFFYWWIWYFILQNWWLVFTNHSCSVSEGNHMHPSRTSDFGALEQNIGLCIEETTILSRGIWLWILLGMLVYNDFIIVQCCIFFFFFLNLVFLLDFKFNAFCFGGNNAVCFWIVKCSWWFMLEFMCNKVLDCSYLKLQIIYTSW